MRQNQIFNKIYMKKINNKISYTDNICYKYLILKINIKFTYLCYKHQGFIFLPVI